ncbi:MAG: sodium-dependent transporter [Firmicutes bacterium]|nr:sodium-dependent transporter [Bacillota bacterium]
MSQKRETWSWRGAFVFAVIGSAVGLGNIWRFPYTAYSSGGGAFLIPYFVALLTAGIPLMIMEFSLGHKFRQGAVTAFRSLGKKFEWAGWWATLVAFVIITYYGVIMAWAIRFVFSSLTLAWGSDPEGYFFGQVLHLTDSPGILGGIQWPLFFAYLAGWLAMYYIVKSGVKGVGKVVMITMPLPVILLIIMIIRGVTLPGAMEGLNFFLKPEWSQLLNPDVWLSAYGQIFYSLSVAMAILIAYASYLPEDAEITNNAFLASFSNCAISFLAGFAVFSTLGYMAAQSGVAVSEVATAGVGLAFVVFPQAINLLPGAPLFGVLFFLLIISAGIDSAFSLVEGVVTSVADRWNLSRNTAVAVVTLPAFLIGVLYVTGAGLYWLDIVDHFINAFSLTVMGLIECIVVGWIYGADKIRKYANERSEILLGKWYDFCIKYLTPAILITIIGMSLYKELQGPYGGYPLWSLLVGGWLLVISIPIVSYLLGRRGKAEAESVPANTEEVQA